HTAPPHTYTLSLHDALPISPRAARVSELRPSGRVHGQELSRRHLPPSVAVPGEASRPQSLVKSAGVGGCADRTLRLRGRSGAPSDRKSTRLNSSHVAISYAV